MSDAIKWDPDKFRLSQSTIFKFLEYNGGRLCGLLFREQILLKRFRDSPSTEKLLGEYFEYKATGALNYHGEQPIPETYQKTTTVDGIRYSPGEAKGRYRIAEQRAILFRKYMEQMGISILRAGIRLERGNHCGGIDIVAQVSQGNWESVVNTAGKIEERWIENLGLFITEFQELPVQNPISYDQAKWTDPITGTEHLGCIVIDLKYTGLIDDTWNDFGWDLGFLEEKARPAIQSKHYTYLTAGLPFFFWLFGSGKNLESRMIRVEFEPGAIEKHERDADRIHRSILNMMNIPGSFQAIPDLGKCSECPMRLECPERATAPKIFGVTFK